MNNHTNINDLNNCFNEYLYDPFHFNLYLFYYKYQ